MFKLIAVSILTLTIIACGDNNENKSPINHDSTTNESEDSLSSIPSCYLRVVGRDSMIAQFIINGDQVNGKLKFDNYEKDGSTGNVTGRIQGDTIKLIYDFQSEGMNSVMHINFKMEEGSIIRGIGEMNVKGDTAFYKQTDKLEYPVDEKWNKVSCEYVEMN